MSAKRTQVTPVRCDTFIEAFRRDDLRLVMPIDLIMKQSIMKQSTSDIGQWIHVTSFALTIYFRSKESIGESSSGRSLDYSSLAWHFYDIKNPDSSSDSFFLHVIIDRRDASSEANVFPTRDTFVSTTRCFQHWTSLLSLSIARVGVYSSKASLAKSHSIDYGEP
ncbi:hypothetical protein G5I_04026 [Acromyrmex echinatior]|uniref:Uncharacterized protein n=1 Tax=Acromyrmex echinatior TaxID=103372 RepID=F4WEM0_ACREC|nr:hypothetical protein G5I_04026 [Acromyrmex echinatior]